MSDLRQRLGNILDELSDETLRDLITESLSAERLEWALYEPGPCPHCGGKLSKQKVKVDYPDYDKRAKALALYLDQAKGKPAEQKKVTVDITVDTVRELTDEQLAAIAAGQAVIDGKALPRGA